MASLPRSPIHASEDVRRSCESQVERCQHLRCLHLRRQTGVNDIFRFLRYPPRMAVGHISECFAASLLPSCSLLCLCNLLNMILS